MTPKVTLALRYVNYADFRRGKEQETALSILSSNKPDNVKVVVLGYPDEKIIAPCSFVIDKSLVRNPVEVFGAERRLPYIKEILDLCASTDCDIFGYINSDILIPQGFFDHFLQDQDVYLFSRIDVGEVNITTLNEKSFRVVWNGHPGCDAFFFRKDWWLKNRDSFSDDLIIGEPAWDLYYMLLVPKLTKRYVFIRGVYHTWHDTVWSEKSIGGKHNMAIWEQFKMECEI
jgi:hypothetical protein